MGGLLSKVLAVLALVLFVPTGLVLASQDAIPGDTTYPVKRTLENVIISLASLHPQSRAFFHLDFSKRRFKEASSLIKRGQSAKDTLEELVIQTNTAAKSVDDFQNIQQKQEYIKKLSQNIAEYDLGLAELEKGSSYQVPIPTSTPTPIRSGPTLTPTPILTPTSTPLYIKQPTSTPAPTSTPIPTPIVVPPPTTQIPNQQKDIAQTRGKLEEIRKRLEEEKTKLEKKKEERQEGRQENQREEGKQKVKFKGRD